MGKQVTKAQLQDEVEQLRALVDHLETRNAELTAAIESLRNERQAPAPVRHVPRTERAKRVVFEFDAELPGDYQRAMSLAKQHNGIVRRAS